VIRVLVVDDDPTCREGLRQLLSLASDLEVVAEASSPDEACAAVRRNRPDVIVVDVEMPGAACLETISNLRQEWTSRHPEPSVVCLAVYPDEHEAALQAGAACFLRKDGPPRELLDAIRVAASRRASADPAANPKPDNLGPAQPAAS
jgi:DNA-binding NarL/FixJ family response regulator